AVDPAFGTGAVKVTPGHDPNDFEIGERHGLPPVLVMNLDGTMNEHAGPYAGMDRFQARQAIVRDFQERGLLGRVEPHVHAVGHCDRCGTIVEPIISKQWFVKVGPLAEPARRVVEEGRIRIVPERFTKIYLNWMENIRDWCISRQLWWGHRIPVWYCRDCPEVTVAVEDPDRCAGCGSRNIEQDPDVLDTWFSSGLWPHSTLGWPDQTEDLRYFYPTSVMETGYDILFFWVARMIMLGLYNMQGVEPFRVVYLHGLVRDAKGEKMSKSKGNVVNPLDAMNRYGTDALRFTLATGGTPGNDQRLSDQRLEGGRNFANKLWNLSRFVILSLEGEPVPPPDRAAPAVEDRWILSRLDRLVESVAKLLEDFQLGEAGRQVHDFVWSEFADWYVELSKVRLRAGDRSPLPVLVHVLQTALRLLHPYMPFVTEEIWQNLRPAMPGAAEALMVAPFPSPSGAPRDEEAERQAEAVMDAIRAIRNVRSERGVEAARRVEAYVAVPDAAYREAFQGLAPAVRELARVEPLHLVADPAEAPRDGVATAVLAASQVVLPLAGLVDLEAERRKLQRAIDGEEANVRRLEARLADQAFRTRAPREVVAREEEKLEAARTRLAGLRQALAELS
ncbi:MAG TPA: valine--tRNA ligase, partial [Dehalococcoidia bacterium]